MKRIISILLIFVLILSFCACAQNTSSIIAKDLGIEEDEEFGGAYIKINSEDFAKFGFNHGDSVDIKFSNGLEFNDVPYFTGYYVKLDGLVLVDYKGYTYIKLAKNCNSTFYKESGFKETDTAEISLNTKEKYLKTEQTLSLNYGDERKEYESDEEFANFRPLISDTIKDHYVFRGASPIDNQRSRTKIVNDLLEKNGIKYEIDIADSEEEFEKLEEEAEDYEYVENLKNSGKICYLNLAMDYRTDEFIKGAVKGLRAIIDNEGPFYIHCLEGKDRTGFICLLIESLCDVPFDEIKADYLKTYENYYGMKTEEELDRIANLYLLDMVKQLTGIEKFEDVTDEKLQLGVKEYLAKGGFSQEEVNMFKDKVCK